MSRPEGALADARAAFLVQLDGLAHAVSAASPGVPVGFAASAIDGDWTVYRHGDGVIFGHNAADLASACQDYAEGVIPALPLAPVFYTDGVRVPADTIGLVRGPEGPPTDAEIA